VEVNGCLHAGAAFIDNIILYSLSAAPTPFLPQRYFLKKKFEEGHGPEERGSIYSLVVNRRPHSGALP
jgi:hypothetical protein